MLFSDHHLFFLAEVSHEQKKNTLNGGEPWEHGCILLSPPLDLVYFLLFSTSISSLFFNCFVLFVNYTFKNKIQKPQWKMEEKLGDRILQFSSVWVTKTTDCVNNKKNLSGIWKMDFFSLFFCFSFTLRQTTVAERHGTVWTCLLFVFVFFSIKE